MNVSIVELLTELIISNLPKYVYDFSFFNPPRPGGRAFAVGLNFLLTRKPLLGPREN